MPPQAGSGPGGADKGQISKRGNKQAWEEIEDDDHVQYGGEFSLKGSFFALMLVLTKDNKTIKRLTQVMLLIDWIQQLAFGLGTASVDWGAQPMQVTFRTFQLPVHELGIILYLIWFVLVVVLIFAMVAFSLYVGDSLHRTGHYQSYMGALRGLRQLASLSMTILYIPTLRSLILPLHPIRVDGEWVLREFQTVRFLSSGHIALLVTACLALIVFLPYIFTLVLLYYDSNELSSNPLARTNSRVECFYVCMKFILTVSFTFLWQYPVVLQILGLVTFLTLATVHCFFPPFYKWRANQFRAGIYTSSAGACAMALVVLAVDSEARFIVIILLPVVLLISFYIGWRICRHALLKFTHRKRVLEWEIAMDASGMSEESNSSEYRHKVKSLVEDEFNFYTPAHVEIATRFLTRYPTPFMLDVAEEVYLAGVRKFSNSAQILLQYSMFLFHRLSRPSAAEQSLLLSKQRKMQLDTEFSLFYKEREHKELMDAQELGADNMDVLSYVEFRKYFHVAEQSHRDAKLYIRRFLDAVSERANGRVLTQLAAVISGHEQRAKESYDLLLGRFPQSQTLLRQYAAYLDEVEGKPGMAAQFYNLAAELVVETVPLFASCTKDFTAELVKHLKASTVARDELIVRQGDMGSEMYIISRGTVEVTNADGSVVFAELHTGSFFGERALLVNQVRNANVRAVTHCDLLILDKRSFNKILRRFPSNRKFFQEIADHREQKRQRAVQSQSHHTGRTGTARTQDLQSDGSQTNIQSERDNADEIELSLEQSHTYVRKHVVAKKLAQIRAMNKKEETSRQVSKLRNRFVGWCIVFTLLFVGIFPVSEEHLRRYRSDIVNQHSSNVRDQVYQDMIGCTRKTGYLADIQSPFSTNNTEFLTSSLKLRDSSLSFLQSHSNLWNQRYATGLTKEVMGERLYSAIPFVPGLDNGQETFWDIGLAIGRYSSDLGTAPSPYAYTQRNYTVTAFALNGLADVAVALADSRDAQYEQVGVNSLFWLYVLGFQFAGGIFLVIMFFLFAIVPLLRRVRHQQALSLKLFHLIPVSVVNQLKPKFTDEKANGGSPREQAIARQKQATDAFSRERNRKRQETKVGLFGRWMRSVAIAIVAMAVVLLLAVFLVNGESSHRHEIHLAGQRIVAINRLLFLSAEWCEQDPAVTSVHNLEQVIQQTFTTLNTVNSDLQLGRKVPSVKEGSKQWHFIHGPTTCDGITIPMVYCNGIDAELEQLRDGLSNNLFNLPKDPAYRDLRWARFNEIRDRASNGLIALCQGSFEAYKHAAESKIDEARTIIFAVGLLLTISSIFYLFVEVGHRGARDIKDSDHRVRRMLKLVTRNSGEDAIPLISDFLNGNHIHTLQIDEAVEHMAREEECADECVLMVKSNKIIMANTAAYAIFNYPPRGLEGLAIDVVIQPDGDEATVSTPIPGIGIKARGIKSDRSPFLVYYQTQKTELSDEDDITTYIIRHTAVFGSKFGKIPFHNFVAIFDILPVPYLVLDSELYIVALNIPAERVTGIARENAVGQSLESLLAHPIADPEAVKSGKELTVVAKHGGDGLVFPIHLRLVETADIGSGISYYSTAIRTENDQDNMLNMTRGSEGLTSGPGETDLTMGDVHVVSTANLLPSYLSIVQILVEQHPHECIVVCDANGSIIHAKDKENLLTSGDEELNLLTSIDESFRLSDDRQLTRLTQHQAPLLKENLDARNADSAVDLSTLSMFHILVSEEPETKVSAVFHRPTSILGVAVRMWTRQINLASKMAVHFVFLEQEPTQVSINVEPPRRLSRTTTEMSRTTDEELSASGTRHRAGESSDVPNLKRPSRAGTEASLSTVDEERDESPSMSRMSSFRAGSSVKGPISRSASQGAGNTPDTTPGSNKPRSMKHSTSSYSSRRKIVGGDEAARMLETTSRQESTAKLSQKGMISRQSTKELLARAKADNK